MTAADLIAAIEAHTGRAGRRNGSNTRLLCPVHDDHHPSLDVAEGEDGRPLVVCRSQGCTFEQVVAAVGRTPADFHADDGDEWTPRGPALARYPYTDESGRLLFEVCRTAAKQFPQRRPDPTAPKGWRWNLEGTRRVLYRLPQVLAAVQQGATVYVVEGERDVEALERLGLVATCNPSGAGKWRPEYADALAGARRVVVLRDDDQPGRVHAEQVAHSLHGRVGQLQVVQLYDPPGDTHRDVADFLGEALFDPAADLARVVEQAPVYLEPPSSAPPSGVDEVDEGGAPVRGSSVHLPRSSRSIDEGRWTEEDQRGRGDEEMPSSADEVGDEEQRPFSRPITEFAALERARADALLADQDGRAVVGAHSLVLLAALGGHGKTTFDLDVFLHMAAGIDYPPWTVPRPVSVLMIENEGPEDAFAAKLRQRLGTFPHELRARLDVCTVDWGGVSLADDALRQRLTQEIAAKGYDLVFGDPLDSLGMAGVGSPDDTRKFLALMKDTGLNRTVAWWLNAHPRKEDTREALNEVSGAWGGKPDTVFLLRRLKDDRMQLRQPKLRWARRGEGPTLLFAFDPDTEAFAFLGEGSKEERAYLREIFAHLRQHPWQTVSEIAAPVKRGGVGVNDRTVKNELEGHPELFESRTADEAVALGRKAYATVWNLQPGAGENLAEMEGG